MEAQKFIKSTIGLRAYNASIGSKLIRVEFYKNANGSVTLKVVDGHNLNQIKRSGIVTISNEEWQDAPWDASDDCVEAKWAMRKCGWSFSCDEE